MLVNVTIKNNSNVRASINFKHNGDIVTNLWDGAARRVTDPICISKLRELRSSGLANLAGHPWLVELRDMDMNAVSEVATDYMGPTTATNPEATVTVAPQGMTDEEKESLLTSWMKFFQDFEFKPHARILNTIMRQLSVRAIADYVVGYFALTRNSYTESLREKVKSPEFKDLAQRSVGTSKQQVNTRLAIWYGDPGTGKTYKATHDFPEAAVVVCHANLNPDELFRGFDFEEEKDENGKVTGSHPVFKPCPVKEAMEQGKVVILDEINLLNDDCRRALQAVTDGKPEAVINNEVVHIKEGFRIIGTMNLVVDEIVCGLPGPLVDRAYELVEFDLTAKQMVSMVF